MNSKRIVEIDALCRSKFTYLKDKGDDWQLHVDDVKANRPWKGDCEDLAFTTMQYLYNEGVTSNHLARLMVSTTNNKIIDHMVALVKDDNSKIWVVGDTNGPAYLLEAMYYSPLMISLASDGIDWKECKLHSSIIASLSK